MISFKGYIKDVDTGTIYEAGSTFTIGLYSGTGLDNQPTGVIIDPSHYSSSEFAVDQNNIIVWLRRISNITYDSSTNTYHTIQLHRQNDYYFEYNPQKYGQSVVAVAGHVRVYIDGLAYGNNSYAFTNATSIAQINPNSEVPNIYFGCITYDNAVLKCTSEQDSLYCDLPISTTPPLLNMQYRQPQQQANWDLQQDIYISTSGNNGPLNYYGFIEKGPDWYTAYAISADPDCVIHFDTTSLSDGAVYPHQAGFRRNNTGYYYGYKASYGDGRITNFTTFTPHAEVKDTVDQYPEISDIARITQILTEEYNLTYSPAVPIREPIYVILHVPYSNPDDALPPSDVDPDDIPPEDNPPIPPRTDNPDPYYDPTSDPDNPDYDPTKDPSSPDYDPDVPHPPFTPPSTEGGGGDPAQQPPQDTIPAPQTPPSYVTTNALFTLYNPSAADLTNLANFLWSPAWSIDTFKKIFANPLDCILGLMVMPYLTVDVSTKNVNVGNIDTGVPMRFFTKQFCDFDCGDFTIEEFYKAYLDYAPYTKVSIFLPYIGDQQLNTDEVMGKTLNVKYRFDLATGDCVAFISVDGSVLYSFSGNCAARLPLSSNNYSGLLPSITGAVIAAGSMAAGVPALGAASALAVSSMKQDIRHTGSISGSAGLMGVQTPYLIITRPRQALPIGQNSFMGYPSFITESLGGLTGYTEVESCHLEHIPCTDEELREIENLLKGGVLF